MKFLTCRLPIFDKFNRIEFLHHDIICSQAERTAAIQNAQRLANNGSQFIIIATNVVADGHLDLTGIRLVVNMDLPDPKDGVKEREVYDKRAGRVNAKENRIVSFVSVNVKNAKDAEDRDFFQEKIIKKEITSTLPPRLVLF